jgi:hypothetical protein
MNDKYEAARTIAQILIRQQELTSPLPRERIREIVVQVLAMPEFREHSIDSDVLVRDLETRFQTSIGQATVLTNDEGHLPWLPQKKGEITWSHWQRYREHLESQWAPLGVDRLDEMTDDILGRLEDPGRDGRWNRRGLVMGHVQSGKTANYIGLICKAADAGYKLIVVLAGMHKNLRSQTQMRLDEGFLGFESMPPAQAQRRGLRPVGVGLIDESLRPDTVTNRSDGGDFKRTVANAFNISPGGRPMLFVVKKNGGVLKNLVEWVEWAADSREASTGRPLVTRVPLLVIDDEADHGSVDTTELVFKENGEPDPDHSPTVINQRIRRLLHCFEQCAYVGYTATPFANIYIHERARTVELGDDLFPRSFLVNMPAPSDYAGPARVFGLDGDPDLAIEAVDGLPLVRHVDDHADSLAMDERSGWMPPRHSRQHQPLYQGNPELPPSLTAAVHAFLLACAARRARGQHPAHNSMLVHVTRFTDVQRLVFDQIRSELATIVNRLRRGEGSASRTLIGALRQMWEEDFVPTTRACNEPPHQVKDWNEILPHLVDVAASVQLRQINGTAKDILDYESHRTSGLTVIVVGGDKLARGLTLEGLLVSYFLRASRMYDTLMQMGRWFGYRPGHLDLCRLYITEDLDDWFQHIATASEELREEFDHMAVTGGSPEDYGLKVRSHPILMITSQVKMRHGTDLQLSFSGSVSETILFHRDAPTVAKNFEAAEGLVRLLGKADEVNPVRSRPTGSSHRWNRTYVWNSAPPAAVKGFLASTTTYRGAQKADSRLLHQFIERQEAAGLLSSWTVALVSAGTSPTFRIAGLEVGLLERAPHPRERIECYGIRRLLSPKDEAIDLDLDVYTDALAETRLAWQSDRGRSRRQTPPDLPAGPMIRAHRPPQRGLLLVYPLNPQDKVDGAMPVIGFGLSFPANLSGGTVTYRVNNVYWNQELGAEQ